MSTKKGKAQKRKEKEAVKEREEPSVEEPSVEEASTSTPPPEDVFQDALVKEEIPVVYVRGRGFWAFVASCCLALWLAWMMIMICVGLLDAAQGTNRAMSIAYTVHQYSSFGEEAGRLIAIKMMGVRHECWETWDSVFSVRGVVGAYVSMVERGVYNSLLLLEIPMAVARGLVAEYEAAFFDALEKGARKMPLVAYRVALRKAGVAAEDAEIHTLRWLARVLMVMRGSASEFKSMSKLNSKN